MTTTTSPPASRRRAPRPSKWPEFVGSWPRLKGRQTPEFESKFDGDESDGDRAAAFGARIGLRCMPWEWLTLRGWLSRQPAEPEELAEAQAAGREPVRLFTHRDVCVECTRQQGKTLLIVLRILFGMFVLGEARIIYTAQRWSTAYDVFKRVWAVIDRVPSLRRRLAEKPSKAGNRGVIKIFDRTGKRVVCEVEFGPRSQDFGRGYTEIDLLIIDEAYDVNADEESNLTGAQSAAKNPQTIYVSTSPVVDMHPKCQSLADLHRMGHDKAPDLYYALYAAPRTMSRDDPEAWALAQPSYGVATNEREIRSKRQKAKTADKRAIFDADYLGWGDYPPDEAEAASPIPDEQWEHLEVDDVVQLVGQRAIAIERTRNRRTWVIASAQRTNDSRIYVEIGYADNATMAAVVAYTLSTVAALNPVALVIDAKSTAIEIKQDLLNAGVEPTITNMTQLAVASGGFLTDALEGQLAHGGQEPLTDGVRSAAMRELPGGAGFTWDEPMTGSSVVYLKAVTLARWALLEFGSTVKRHPVKPRSGATTAPTHHTPDHFDAMSAAF